MTLRFNVFGIDVASIIVDLDLGDHNSDESVAVTVMDKVSDYFTRRFVKRRLL